MFKKMIIGLMIAAVSAVTAKSAKYSTAGIVAG